MPVLPCGGLSAWTWCGHFRSADDVESLSIARTTLPSAQRVPVTVTSVGTWAWALTVMSAPDATRGIQRRKRSRRAMVTSASEEAASRPPLLCEIRSATSARPCRLRAAQPEHALTADTTSEAVKEDKANQGPKQHRQESHDDPPQDTSDQNGQYPERREERVSSCRNPRLGQFHGHRVGTSIHLGVYSAGRGGGPYSPA